MWMSWPLSQSAPVQSFFILTVSSRPLTGLQTTEDTGVDKPAPAYSQIWCLPVQNSSHWPLVAI